MNRYCHKKRLTSICQPCWKFLSAAADGATKLRKGHRVKNVSFPHVSTESNGALNTLPEPALSGEQGRGHITSNLQRARSLNPDVRRGPAYSSHAPQKPPTFYFHCLFFYCCTRSSQRRPDLYSRAQLRVAHHKELQGVCEVFHRWCYIVFPLFSQSGKVQRKVFLCLLSRAGKQKSIYVV